MSDDKKLNALFEALADNLESLSDEALLAEVQEEGFAPDVVALETKALADASIKKYRQRALFEAKAKYRDSKQRIENLHFKLPANPLERRQLLILTVAQQQQAGRMLTAQHRNLAEMTDEDVESWLQQFGALGLIDQE